MVDISKLPHINLQLFMKLLQTLSVEQLRKIPVEKLPEKVPDHFAEHLSPEVRRFLEDFHMAKQMAKMNEYNEHCALFGKETADIIEQIKSGRLVEQTAYFVQNIQKLIAAADKHALQKCTQTPPLKLLKLSDTIHGMLYDIREDYIQALRYVPVLKKNYDKGESVKARLKEILAMLRKQLLPVHKMIVDYYQVRLMINLCDMRHLKIKINRSEVDIAEIDTQIQLSNEELEKYKTLWSKIAHKKEEVINLQNQVNELYQMRRQLEVPIDEDRLTKWLDSLVDVMIGPGTDDLAQSKYAEHAKKLLYFLLVKYCEQQESAARDVAENPFIVVNAEKAIDFLLTSEKFILHYFEKKRKEMASWISEVVTDKKSSLDDIRRELLNELKKNIRYVR